MHKKQGILKGSIRAAWCFKMLSNWQLIRFWKRP